MPKHLVSHCLHQTAMNGLCLGQHAAQSGIEGDALTNDRQQKLSRQGFGRQSGQGARVDPGGSIRIKVGCLALMLPMQ
ncbi:MAG: hypothetical protein B7X29_08240 [Halothiobacillus sp. 13-55-115]|jgi:hypothetical protein|nr:MAG: hypothetical protein B7X29_08240 [Halothiobacillus sp. 13-55-115]